MLIKDSKEKKKKNNKHNWTDKIELTEMLKAFMSRSIWVASHLH